MTDIVPTTWHDLTSARALWRDAPGSDEALQTLLDVAQQQVVAYAPVSYDSTGAVIPIDPNAVPVNYRDAQLRQSRNNWNASKVDPSNAGMGDDTFAIRAFPMDWIVKAIIRPKNPIPTVDPGGPLPPRQYFWF